MPAQNMIVAVTFGCSRNLIEETPILDKQASLSVRVHVTTDLQSASEAVTGDKQSSNPLSISAGRV